MHPVVHKKHTTNYYYYHFLNKKLNTTNDHLDYIMDILNEKKRSTIQSIEFFCNNFFYLDFSASFSVSHFSRCFAYQIFIWMILRWAQTNLVSILRCTEILKSNSTASFNSLRDILQPMSPMSITFELGFRMICFSQTILFSPFT